MLTSRYHKKLMSRHTNNPDCSVTVVKLAGYNNDDDHLLLLMLKWAGGLVDPYLTTFLKIRILITSVYQVEVFWLCLETVVLRCSGDALQLFKLFGTLLLSPRSKTVISGLSPFFKLFGALLLSLQSKTVISSLSPFFKLFGALLLPTRSKTGISSCLLACSLFSCHLVHSLIFLRERLQFCSPSKLVT